MNLHQIVSASIGQVNPFISIATKISNGYTIGANYKQIPTYVTGQTTGQVQALSGQDLKHLLGLNIQGVSQKVYLNGNYEGLLRDDSKGGDILTFSINGGAPKDYLIVTVFERWPDWCSVGVKMQVNP
jgi:hypothetical protein